MLRLLSLILCLAAAPAFAATETNLTQGIESIQAKRSSSYAWDFSVNSFSNNYGLGAGISTPNYFNNAVNFRLSATYAWVQGVAKTGASQTWAPYGAIRAGVYGGGYVFGTVIRGYGGGGPIFVLPSDSLSKERTVAGGFGLVGLEFPIGDVDSTGAVYLELGGMGTGATADKLKEEPIYANGFLASWGFRYLL